MRVLVTKDTVFKQRPVAAAQLAPDERLNVPGGEFPLIDFQEAPAKHIFVTLERPLRGRTQWHIFTEHIEMLEEDPHPTSPESAQRVSNTPTPAPAPTPAPTPAPAPAPAPTPAPAPAPVGAAVNPVGGTSGGASSGSSAGRSAPPAVDDANLLRLPGNRQVSLHEPIISGGNFTWAEATKSGSRIPASRDIVDNIVRMAERMEAVRDQLGGLPIRVTSWYRDPATNARVGGASRSMHLTGLAVDFYLDALSDAEVQRRLDSTWEGGLGYGRSFTHLDARDYTARFNYG
jgi:hypothetical protein